MRIFLAFSLFLMAFLVGSEFVYVFPNPNHIKSIENLVVFTLGSIVYIVLSSRKDLN
jgi:hypothetical protein